MNIIKMDTKMEKKNKIIKKEYKNNKIVNLRRGMNSEMEEIEKTKIIKINLMIMGNIF